MTATIEQGGHRCPRCNKWINDPQGQQDHEDWHNRQDQGRKVAALLAKSVGSRYQPSEVKTLDNPLPCATFNFTDKDVLYTVTITAGPYEPSAIEVKESWYR